MKLVGFGCSFTYGSELQSPEIDPDDHWANTRYRESHCWLGLLAKRIGCEFDNRAQPANSNMAIAQQIADYFINLRNPSEPIVICIGWSEHTRMSWYSDHWTHNGFAGEQDGWFASAKEWVTFSTKQSHEMFTQNAKLIANSICKAHDVPILQFNALGKHRTTQYDNYFLNGLTMESVLEDAQKNDNRLNLFASGRHPNELGHEWFTKRLHDFAKERII